MPDMNEIEELIRDLASRWDEWDEMDAPELGRRLRATIEELDMAKDEEEQT